MKNGSRPWMLWIGLWLLVIAQGAIRAEDAAPAGEPTPVFRELRRFPAAEAHQAVAVDETSFYAIANRSIGRYDKRTGQRLAGWEAPAGSSVAHLNSGVVVEGKLYCAHSNWPRQPYENSVEIWDARTLEPLERKVLPAEGAATWIDWHRGHWWMGFAEYGAAERVAQTRLVRLDENWQPAAEWRFPKAVIERFLPMSNSGASWGPDGRLYATGHDHRETYVLSVPDRGETLQLERTVPMPAAGQGIAWDRTDLGVLYGIERKTKEVVVSRLSHTHELVPLKGTVSWKRDEGNPVLPPGVAGSFDASRCMNPWVLRVGDEYHLYYSGGDAAGKQRICLATAPVTDVSRWHRQGPLFETGAAGAFDARWCVLPHVVQMAPGRWHLYYTGNAGQGSGLSAFPGIGLATSGDGKTWTRFSEQPLLEPSREPGSADAIGVAGGSVLKVSAGEGSAEWRFYYTGCPTVGEELSLNQQKTICLAVSDDGIQWEKRGAVLYRDSTRDYEDIGVAGPVVRQQSDGTFRMWYSAIGTRWGFYSICYAESADGLHWSRGANSGDNLQLGPSGSGWEQQMVEYPSVIDAGDGLRLFYCGNGYGRTGIGTAASYNLR